MKYSRQLFYIFVPLLLVFFWRTAVFWWNSRYENVENTDVLLYGALVGIESLSLFFILVSTKIKRRERRIHIVCFLWELLMLMVLMYNRSSISACMKCLAWPLFFESTYLFIRLNPRLKDSFRKVYYLLVFLGLIVFLGAMLRKSFGSQTNMIYFLVLPVPVILLTRNTKWRNVVLLLTTFFAVLSMKRSMILSMVLFWVIIGCKYLFGSKNNGVAIALSALVLIAGYASFRIVDNVSGGFLSSRFDDDEDDVTNGRETIYLVTLEMIADSSPVDLILGHGHNAVRADSIKEVSAHNEVLEIIYDYGIIILLVYFGLWFYVIKELLFHYRNDTVYLVPFTLSVCIFAVMAMVSQLVLYVSYFLYLVMFWAIVAAARETEK